MILPHAKPLLRLALLTAALAPFAQTPAGAAEAVTLHTSIKDHRFQPSELKAPANTPITFSCSQPRSRPPGIREQDAARRKGRRGGREITMQTASAQPGRYHFFDDFHQDTTDGDLIVE